MRQVPLRVWNAANRKNKKKTACSPEFVTASVKSTNVLRKSVSVHPYRNLYCGKLDARDVRMQIAEWTNTWLERRGSKEYTSKILRGYVVSSSSTNIFCFMLCKNVQKIPPKLQGCRMYQTSNLFRYTKNNMRR